MVATQAYCDSQAATNTPDTNSPDTNSPDTNSQDWSKNKSN